MGARGLPHTGACRHAIGMQTTTLRAPSLPHAPQAPNARCAPDERRALFTRSPGQIIFYSDQPMPRGDQSLPVVALSNVTTYADAQDRFTYLIMPHAVQQMKKRSLTWLMWIDDDTWVWPKNLHRLLRMYDPTRWVWLGQTCPFFRQKQAFCGGAGFAMSLPLAQVSACVAPLCTKHAALEIPYDRRMGVCFADLLRVKVVDRPEFNSQPPDYYATETGKKDRPAGFGRAVTFHYLKTPGVLPAEIKATEARLRDQEKTLAEREASLTHREAAVAAREADLRKAEARVRHQEPYHEIVMRS